MRQLLSSNERGESVQKLDVNVPNSTDHEVKVR
jgi:hypothetical protein